MAVALVFLVILEGICFTHHDSKQKERRALNPPP
jgi:hypothetical protein